MSYVEPRGPVEPRGNQIGETAVITQQVTDYHDRIRWGPIIAGIVTAIAIQLVLSALGAAIGLTASAAGSEAADVGIGVGIWAIISLLISLFIGGWIAAACSGPMNSKTALLQGLVFWATTLAVGSWLLTTGVSGIFGIIASNAGEVINQVNPNNVNVPNVETQQLESVAAGSAKAAWTFLFGSLLGLVAALIGSKVGARKPRART